MVVWGVITVALTELLSPFHLLRRVPLAVAWTVAGAVLLAYLYRRRAKVPRGKFRPVECTIAVVIAGMAAVVGVTAWLSPPNSADAMAYHMPRVLYWAQAGSVAFFPTPYFNQITLQPLAEYFALHTYVLSGGDHFVNLVTFGAFCGSIAGVSAIAAAMGLGARAQALAALVCATLPNGILQASGAKNDWLLTLWLVAMVYFAVRCDRWFTGLALGLALATKATAYLFAPPILLAVLWGRAEWRRIAAPLAAAVLLINFPQYARNWRLSGSPLGYDSAQGDGFFRWRNEHPGWKSTVSNALRHLSDQLGARSPQWNLGVFDAVVRIHRALSLDPQDPATTWRWSRYEPPLNANHEANANNRWHLLLLVLASLWAIWRSRTWTVYAAGLAGAFLLFCFYLKWQPFLARLELPLFVLGAPLAAFALGARRPAVLSLAAALFLVTNARLPLVDNWTRPLKGPHSLLVTSRDGNYFSDMSQWNNRSSYLEAVERTARTGCATVGMDISENQLEYPFEALLRERNRAVWFEHTGVENASARYYPVNPPRPCVVLCLDCIGNQKKMALYREMGPPVTIGRFLLFGAILTPQ